MNANEDPHDPRWRVVHDRLDAGVDPLADPAVAAACALDPEFARRLVEMLCVLETVAVSVDADVRGSAAETAVIAGSPRDRRSTLLLASAAVILTARLLFVFADSSPTDAPEFDPRAATGTATVGRLAQAAILDGVHPARIVNARFRAEHWSEGRVRGGERLLVPSQRTDATRRWGRSPRDPNDDRIRTVGGLRVTSWSSTGTTSNSR